MKFILTYKKKVFASFLLLSVIAFLFLVCMPKDFFDYPKEFSIESGESLYSVGQDLEEIGVIREKYVFLVFLKIFGKEKSIQSGSYTINQPLNTIKLSYYISHNLLQRNSTKVVIKEGDTFIEIGEAFEKSLPNFDKENFFSISQSYEGRLFPDTYFVDPESNEEDILEVMLENFDKKTKDLFTPEILGDKTENEILTMASIIELETNFGEERPIVSGILWKRIRIGMALQVDAPFLVYHGKGSDSLTLSDLDIDEPWNTYENRGLPPSPITNPGLESIEAALFPVESPYLYYLHDKDGNIHYGKDFEEHKRNKDLYL